MDLMSLIQSAGQMPNPASAPADPDIVVRSDPKRTIEEDTRSEPSVRKTDELVARKGMFGLKGTLRDVLGLIGDSLLVGSGKNAIYRPVREQEKLGSAIYGYNNDPQGAIDRAAIVNPDVAIDLQKQYGLDRRTDQAIAAQKITGQQKAAQVLASWVKTATPSNYAELRPRLQAYSDKYELGEQFGDAYDADQLAGTFSRGMSPDQITDNDRQAQAAQALEAYRKAQIDIGESRVAEQGRHNRKMESRPPASRPDHGPSLSNVEAGIARAVANGTETPAQRRYFDQRLKRPEGKSGGLAALLAKSRGSSGPSLPPPPGGGSIRKIK